ncbi:linear amide C-N hydrolase [Ancylobacter pratisalsi]|uniref:Linear amide C-N hydrolase n=1 Tax=Ancylobacter pratisalsi TaxID=1745854 RepID=A0A6P1YQ38_9HYPH|nr:linear amide C-N hydrolase [Ancylobacter pratisalsi]QIB35558.1 linear amide C-N hydrolase [Ancylobacter pratisalsi]
MCTSLVYSDAAGKAYFGRTLELTIDLPYQIVYLPAGFPTRSQIAGHPAVEYKAKRAMLSVTMPCRVPTADSPIGIEDLKVLEGINDQGLTFSLLSYPTAGGGHHSVAMTQSVLSASDLGTWVLGQFSTVAEVKAALAEQPILLTPLAILGGVESPFHYVMHDATGASAVIEFNRGEMSVHDNPVGVMTNGPDFRWHLTNLSNYTFLSNVDQSSASFGSLKVAQPDSGIATAGLPASNTSVGRFVRAAFYAQFAEKAATPDLAVRAVAHIMNNFDRPRGITIDYPELSGGHLEVAGLENDKTTEYATEFTTWTSLADLDRRLFFVRDYQSLNFSCIDLGALAGTAQPKVLPLKKLNGAAMDATEILKGATPS